MKRLDDHLRLMSRVRISNVWLLQFGGRQFLIDTGHRVERPMLRLDLWEARVRQPGDLDAVILTHRHSDHAGNADWLRRTFDCPIVAHHEDAAFLSGQREPPKLAGPDTAWWARWLCHIEDRYPARVEVDELLEDGRNYAGLDTFWVPGHTVGSVLLHHEVTGTLFSGDAIVTGPPVVRVIERMRLSYDDFSEDGPRARRSVRDVLADIPMTRTVCSGHGPPVRRDASAKLRKLGGRDSLWPSIV